VNNSNQTKDDSRFLFEMVNQRYGDRLTSEELEQVQKGVEAIHEAAAALRTVELKNSDEPIAMFIPYRKDA
jgi:hypothetical protein